MTTKNLIQLIDIPDFRFTAKKPDVNYGDVASDCENKSISILSAIHHISELMFSMSEDSELDVEKIRNLSGIISDLADLGVATNKIGYAASFLCGLQDGNHGA